MQGLIVREAVVGLLRRFSPPRLPPGVTPPWGRSGKLNGIESRPHMPHIPPCESFRGLPLLRQQAWQRPVMALRSRLVHAISPSRCRPSRIATRLRRDSSTTLPETQGWSTPPSWTNVAEDDIAKVAAMRRRPLTLPDLLKYVNQ